MSYSEVMNSLGLKDGKIPAGGTCPFAEKCKLADPSLCPTKTNLLTYTFSCGLARGLAMVNFKEAKKCPKKK